MRRLLRGPRRVLLRLLGVKRRRRYSNKNKYVAMLLNHDKQLKALNTRCSDLTKVDSNLIDCMDNLENDVINKHYREVNRKLYDEALTKRDCRIEDLEDEVTHLKAEIQEILQTN